VTPSWASDRVGSTRAPLKRTGKADRSNSYKGAQEEEEEEIRLCRPTMAVDSERKNLWESAARMLERRGEAEDLVHTKSLEKCGHSVDGEAAHPNRLPERLKDDTLR